MQGAFLQDDGLPPSWGGRRTINGVLLIFEKTLERGPRVDLEMEVEDDLTYFPLGLLRTEKNQSKT